MPKPKSKKKESDGTDLREADSSLNDETNEIIIASHATKIIGNKTLNLFIISNLIKLF